MRRTGLAVGFLAALVSAAFTPIQRTAILGATPSWVLPGATVDCDFAHFKCFLPGQGYQQFASLFTTTRAQTVPSYAATSTGLLVPFAANTPRITDQGWLIEQGSTNTALYARDMTQASWTAVNMTAALNATGADGIANSATTLTATAGNATILQALTIGSTTETYSVYLKRVSGTGTINISENGGSSWTACTLNSTSFTRCSVEAVLANPSVGIQIVTNGDRIIADFNQNEASTYASSPIPTTTVAVTRNADVISGNAQILAFYSASGMSLYSAFLLQNGVASATNKHMYSFSDGTTSNLIYGRMAGSTVTGQFATTTGGSAAAPGNNVNGIDNAINKMLLTARAGTNNSFDTLNGYLGASTSSPASLPSASTITHFYLGAQNAGINQPGSYIRRFTILPPVTQAQAQQLTALP